MAELGELFKSVLQSATQTVTEDEAAHLAAQVKTLQALAGKTPTLADVQALYASGELPDYFAADTLTVNAQLVVASQQELTAGGTAGGTLGPITLQGSLAYTTRTGSNTNLSVTATLVRQSKSAALQNAFQALQAGTPPAPSTAVPSLPA